MSTLHTHLKAHHSVKMIDGVEVIKLPNWMEFWDRLHDDHDIGFEQTVSIFNLFKEGQSKKPTLSEFVTVGENGEVLEEPTKKDTGDSFFDMSKYYVDIDIYTTAQANVIYEGWEVITNGKNLKSVAGTFNGKRFRLDFVNGICKAAFASIVFKTTDDLNREVQLYLKIK
jgi:hypothetical protein